MVSQSPLMEPTSNTGAMQSMLKRNFAGFLARGTPNELGKMVACALLDALPAKRKKNKSGQFVAGLVGPTGLSHEAEVPS